MIDRSQITGLVLAGGRGSRMGGVDKGLQLHDGMPLALHALLRLAPQVGAMMINANRNLDAYAADGRAGVARRPARLPRTAGRLPHRPGALHDAVTSSPCPATRRTFPTDLVAASRPPWRPRHADVAMAATREDGELPPAAGVLPDAATVHESLLRFTASGRRKIDAWTATLPMATRALRRCRRLRQRQHARTSCSSCNAMTEAAPPSLQEIASCIAGYDPKALPVAQAREFIARLVAPVRAVESLALRSALGRVLAGDVVSPIDVPGHDNSAMDGYALRGADLDRRGRQRCRSSAPPSRARVSTARSAAGEVRAHHDRRGDAGRPRHGRPAGVRDGRRRPGRIPAGVVRAGDNRRLAGEDLAAAPSRSGRADRCARPTSACSPRSDRPRCACFGAACASPSSPPATSCARSASRSTPGSVYDSNRYTLWGVLQRLGVEVHRPRRRARRPERARGRASPARRAMPMRSSPPAASASARPTTPSRDGARSAR